MIPLLLVASLLATEPPEHVKRAKDALPAHSLQTCGTARLMCFQLTPFKLLLEQSDERLRLLGEADALILKVGLLMEKVEALEALVVTRDKQLKLIRTDHARLLGKWKEENRLRHAAEIKTNSPWPIVTMVVGGLLGVSGALWGAFNHEEPAPWILTGSGVIVLGIGTVDLFF